MSIHVHINRNPEKKGDPWHIRSPGSVYFYFTPSGNHNASIRNGEKVKTLSIFKPLAALKKDRFFYPKAAIWNGSVGHLLIHPKNSQQTKRRFEDLRGFFKHQGKPLSNEELCSPVDLMVAEFYLDKLLGKFIF